MKLATIDFETESAESLPIVAPKPVGCAIRVPGRKPRYLAFGHPTENNCTKREAEAQLKQLSHEYRVLVFNGKFDERVGEEHLRMSFPNGIEDAFFLAFLFNPHAKSHALKPFTEDVLKIPTDARDRVQAWIYEFIAGAKRQKKNWGQHICKAPGRLVGEYAIDDVTRTDKLFDFLLPKIKSLGMLPAYQRELQLLPVLIDNERVGIRIDAKRLSYDIDRFRKDLSNVDRWCRKRLQAKDDLNLESGNALADALEYAGLVKSWIPTPTGERSTSKENLLEVIEDKSFAMVLNYRARLANAVQSFFTEWQRQSEICGGFIHTQWNQMKGMGDSERGGYGFGARTARLSSHPNFQNILKEPVVLRTFKVGTVYAPNEIPLPYDLLALLGKDPITDEPSAPNLRDYIIPDDSGETLIDADYSQQELRILAHFENDKLKEEYIANPTMDVHKQMQLRIKALTGIELARRAVKVLNFGVLYGMGLTKLAKSLDTTDDKARELRTAMFRAYPGIKAFDMNCKHESKTTTWGGRVYEAEQAVDEYGNPRDLRYKLLNYAIQGSAADCTKEAMIRYHNHPKRRGRLLLSVHDELLVSVPTRALKEEKKVLAEAMESVEFRVPMLTDATTGKTWASCK